MGFLQAMWALGGVEGGKGLEPFLVLPLEREGRVVRVHLKVEDPRAAPLNVLGLEKVDLGDFQPEPEMKLKYLFRNRVGSAAPWGFSPKTYSVLTRFSAGLALTPLPSYLERIYCKVLSMVYLFQNKC